jgi:predicted anti-sigma-YlaC factor YlaD
MDCDRSRTLISALLDNELSNLERAALDDHLARCDSCRTYLTDAIALTGSLQRGRAPEVPDLTPQLLAAFKREDVPFHVDLVRVLVATLGLIHIAGAIALYVNSFHGGVGHIGNDLAAAELAIGVGLVLAAARPAHSTGLLAVIVVLACASVAVGLADVLSGRAGWHIESAHLIDVLAAVLLWRLSARSPMRPIRSQPAWRQSA